MLETPVYNSYCRMSSIIFMGEVCRLYDLGFLEGGCTRVGVPYIYYGTGRVVIGGDKK